MNLKGLLAALFLCAVPAANSQTFIQFYVSDPYALLEGVVDPNLAYINTTGRTQVTAASAVAAGCVAIFFPGQSLVENTATGSFTPVNPTKVLNLNIYDGLIYRGQNPVLGTGSPPGFGTNSPILQIADSLVTAGTFPCVVTVPLAVGGSRSADWATGGLLKQRIVVAMKRVNNTGLTAKYVLWHDGERDSNLNTPAASVTSNLRDIAQTFIDNGFTGRFVVALESWNGTTTNTGVRTGETNAASVPLKIVLGADWDTLTSGTYRADGLHLTGTGASAMAALDVAVIQNCETNGC